ncbi:superoxide dismutase, partial [Vibrio parahaemolyticus V-223/04]
QCRKGR